MEKILDKLKEYWKIMLLVVCALIAGGILYIFTNSPKPAETLSIENLSSSSTKSSVSKFNSSSSEKNKNEIMVDLKGAVAKPNVYQISSDERLVDLIRQAGGFTDQADPKSINLSAKLKDEEVIYVPKVGESSSSESTDSPTGSSVSNQVSTTSGPKVNINKADLTELQKLTGIGQKKAQDIIDFRMKNGDFKSIEDLGKVSGFGDKTLEKLKDEISID
ncbi:helix-hairpin-helix domain-containing protein [Lactococcus cremoris]|jgi:competence protein ComEA|nr:helix-hairpin-helix domain-containing protein [Lactococcus cremoris]MBS5601832.1 helix-hairpin-helix domain-containing protein [Lactococcus lactis]ADJ60930.1 putative competence protein [Lactococcus cremoris subsp. cremoris NZ9000]KZK50317.1 Late competence protein ComEA DNA receptor [Lactococcus cremoris]MCT0446697.1 ComEA family DNA-binding protein [Lactococcus cremoris]MCT0450428.1 ComEA family DNA-binding protein [Lactococcus cremoris]